MRLGILSALCTWLLALSSAHADVIYYVSDASVGGGSVLAVQSNGGSSIFASISSPRGLAFDSSGNLYVADGGNQTINKLDSLGNATEYATGFNSPVGIAFDSVGNLFVSDNGTNTLYKVAPGGGAATTFATGFNNPLGIAIDSDDNIFVANLNNSDILKVTSGGGVSIFATGLVSPGDVVITPQGRMFAANWGVNYVSEIFSNGTNTPFSFFGNGLRGISSDSTGLLYVSSQYNALVYQVTTSGVASISSSAVSAPSFIAAVNTTSAVPEPSSLVLIASAVSMMAFRVRRSRRSQKTAA